MGIYSKQKNRRALVRVAAGFALLLHFGKVWALVVRRMSLVQCVVPLVVLVPLVPTFFFNRFLPNVQQ